MKYIIDNPAAAKKQNLLLIILFFCYFPGFAQFTPPIDSIKTAPTKVTWTQSKAFKTLAAPTILIGAGLFTFHDNSILDRYDVQRRRQELIPNFRTHVDDYLQFAPIPVVYGLDMLHVQTKHGVAGQTVRLLVAEILSQAIIMPLKKYTHIERPDHSNFRSFPSGHTTQAFVSATFMHKELGGISPWYSVGAYTSASAVGALRVLNNRHWLSDVLVGAGIGILSTNLVYLIFPDEPKPHKNKKLDNVLIFPVVNPNGFGICVVSKL